MAKYNDRTVSAICGYIRDGDTQRTAAIKAGITEATFYEWANSKIEFSEAVKAARQDFLDGIREKLEASLWKRATGYKVTEVETEYVNNGKDEPKIKRQRKKVKEIAPDTAAIIFALTNVAPEFWRQRQSVATSAQIKIDEGKYFIDDLDTPECDELVEKLQDARKNRIEQEKSNED